MRRAGVAVAAAQGVSVIRAEDDNPPRIGDPVVDDSLETVGTVVDIIGPVERPYLVVSPGNDHRPASLLGKPLYLR